MTTKQLITLSDKLNELKRFPSFAENLTGLNVSQIRGNVQVIWHHGLTRYVDEITKDGEYIHDVEGS